MVTGPVGRAFADAEMIFSTLEGDIPLSDMTSQAGIHQTYAKGFGFQPKLARDDPSL